MPPDTTRPPDTTMRPAVAVELPPVARLALREVRRALIDRPDSAYDVLSTAMVVLAERQMLSTPEEAAGIARASYIEALAGAADDVERLLSEHECGFTDARSCHQALTQLYGRWRTEAGKDTPTGGESTRADDDAVARCRLCGCTEASACEGGCVWVPTDLMVDVCSACVPAGPDVVRMTWEQRVTLYPGVVDGTPAEVPMRTPAGVPAVVGLTDAERRRLGSMLTLQGPAAAPCATPRCGITDGELRESIPELGVARYGWILVQVAGADAPPAWFCGSWCAGEAIRRASEELAAADAAAAAAAGPASYAEALDEQYGPGAGDEYLTQMGEAVEEGFAEERVYDPSEAEAEEHAARHADAYDPDDDVDDPADDYADGGDGRG